MKLTKGLRALIESEGGTVRCICIHYGHRQEWVVQIHDCEEEIVLTCEGPHDTKREAIDNLDAVVGRMARVFTGAK